MSMKSSRLTSGSLIVESLLLSSMMVPQNHEKLEIYIPLFDVQVVYS